MIAERTAEIQLAYLPYKRFSGLGPGEGMDLDEADEVVFNLERKSTRIRSHFKGADHHLIQAVFLSNIWGDPKSTQTWPSKGFLKLRLIEAMRETHQSQLPPANHFN